MPFVRRGGERRGRERGGVGKKGRRRREAIGCLVKVWGFLAWILAAREKKTKTLTPSITIAITLLSQGEKKINDWQHLTSSQHLADPYRMKVLDGEGVGGAYRSVFTYAVKHYFTARVTISISQRHSLFKQGESRQRVSFLFGGLSNGQQSGRQWAPTMAMNGQVKATAIKVLFTWHKKL